MKNFWIFLFVGTSFGFLIPEKEIEKPFNPRQSCTRKGGGLTGFWVNELNSTVFICQAAEDGALTGWYYSIVGNTQQRWWPLRGMNGGSQPSAFGFVVNWVDGYSCTAWSGQSYVVHGKEVLITTWILTIKTPLESNWASTLVGKDIFERLRDKPI